MTRRNWPVLLLTIIILLTGCSPKASDSADIDPDAAAKTLVESITFQDTLVQADAAAAEAFYNLDDKVESYAIYISGSGATAEEVAVIKMKDVADTNEGLVLMEARRADLIARFQDYVPAELTKLQNPILTLKGPVVIMVLADDFEQAQKAAESIS